MSYEDNCPECGNKANFELCLRCNGEGFVGVRQRCVVCDGRGGIVECDYCWDAAFEQSGENE